MHRSPIADVHGEVLSGVPEWLVLGVALGLLASVGVAGAFLVGVRLFPTQQRDAAASVGGDSRRREEIREYLHGIGEPFVEDHSLTGETVDFYLSTRDVAITFDPQSFYRIQRTRTHAVLVEHEMPGANLGYRLPFETPTVERGGEPEHPRARAFATLGLPATASPEEVKDAYRAKVKEVHPDHGGDSDEFKQVKEAYTTAKRHANA